VHTAHNSANFGPAIGAAPQYRKEVEQSQFFQFEIKFVGILKSDRSISKFPSRNDVVFAIIDKKDFFCWQAELSQSVSKYCWIGFR
jgi:hypothetical protein